MPFIVFNQEKAQINAERVQDLSRREFRWQPEVRGLPSLELSLYLSLAGFNQELIKLFNWAIPNSILKLYIPKKVKCFTLWIG